MSTRDAPAIARTWQRAEILDLLAGSIAVLLLVFAFTGLTGPARLLLTAAFAFFVPGRAIVSNWSRMAGWSDIGMSIALSLGTLTLFATVALWARMWHPLGLFEAEAALSLVGLCVAVARRREGTEPPVDRSPPRPAAPRNSPASRARQVDPRYRSVGRVPPRPARPRPPAGGIPPGSRPRDPAAGEAPPRQDPRYPSRSGVPPIRSLPPRDPGAGEMPRPRPRPRERY